MFDSNTFLNCFFLLVNDISRIEINTTKKLKVILSFLVNIFQLHIVKLKFS